MSVYFRNKKIIMVTNDKKKEVIRMEIRKLPVMITIRQASDETGLPDYLLRRLCITGRIKAIKSGKKYWLNKDSLCKLLAKKKEEKHEEILG